MLVAVLLAGCKASFEIGTGTADAKSQLEAAAQAWSDAFNKCDAARISGLYAADAALWGTVSQALISTPEGIREYFGKVCASVAFGEQHIRVHGDSATNSGSYTFTLMREGKPVPVPARYTFAYRKVGSRWLIVDHHSSLRPAPPR